MEAPAISVADLRVRRGSRLVLPGVVWRSPAEPSRAPRPERVGQDDADAVDRRRQVVEAGAVRVLDLPPGRTAAAAARVRLRDTRGPPCTAT